MAWGAIDPDENGNGPWLAIGCERSSYHLAEQIPGCNYRKSDSIWRAPLSWAAWVAVQTVWAGQPLDISPGLAQWADQQWAAVQNAYAWRSELDARTPLIGKRLDDLDEETGRKLFTAQRGGAAWLYAMQRAVLGDPQGNGKTPQLIRGIQLVREWKDAAGPWLVIAPAAALYNWQRELAAWAPELSVRVIDGSAARRRKQLTDTEPADVLVIGWKTLRLHTRLARYPGKEFVKCDEHGGGTGKTAVQCEVHDKELNAVSFAGVIADECVTGDTHITTPDGTRLIRNLKPGDLVLGVDHRSGERVWSQVQQVIATPMRKTIRVAGLDITPDHPVWLSDESLKAYDNRHESELRGTGNLSVVREDVPASQLWEGRNAKILFPQLPVADSAQHTASTRTQQADDAENDKSSRRAGKTQPASARAVQSVQQSGSTRKGTPDQRGTGLAEPEWRERNGTYCPASYVAGATRGWLDCGTGHRYEAAPDGVSVELQSRLGESSTKGSHRDAWKGARQERNSQGQEETRIPGEPGVGSAVGMEPGDPGESLWNLRTATGNYFANGTLVHNCHRMKDAGSKQTRAVWHLAHSAQFFWPATGTPVGDNIADLWPVLHGIDARAFPSKSRYLDLYAVKQLAWSKGTEYLGIRPETANAFQATVQPLIRRIPKEVARPGMPARLPVSFRNPEMSPAQARIYGQMKKQALAELESTTVSAVNTGVAFGRLCQVASAMIETKDGEDGDGFTKQLVRMTAPSSKVDDLIDFLGDNPGPVVVCMNSPQLLALCESRLAAEKITHCSIRADKSASERDQAVTWFQNGETRVILMTGRTGGEAITLTASDTVLFLQPDPSYFVNEQVTGRVDRIGQENPVRVIYSIAPDTVEERLFSLSQDKTVRAEEVTRDADLVKWIITGEDEPNITAPVSSDVPYSTEPSPEG